jgi:uncharacterized RDD family membrane protein YckC
MSDNNKTESPFKKNRAEIFWNIINAGLAGLLVLLGSFVSGSITWQGLFAALIASLIVVTTRFYNYWAKEEEEYKTLKAFEFV